MNKKITLAAAAFTLFLAGCQDASEPTASTSSYDGAAATSEEQTVAASPDAVPPSDAAMDPQAPAAETSGGAEEASQADSEELTKAEESADLPQPGQVNNHSTLETDREAK